MSDQHILIIEDEENIANLVKLYLKKEGFIVDWAANGQDGLTMSVKKHYELIILDLMLPDIDGFEVCKQIRKKSDLPLIMLTAKDTEIDKVVGLEIGADDYLTKPFSPRELTARIKAILRRLNRPTIPERSVKIGPLTIDADRRLVKFEKRDISLTAKEFDLLYYLAKNKSLVLTRDKLLAAVWGYDYIGDTRTVDVHINQVRSKLGDTCPIVTVWGVGYKIDDKV